MTHFAFSTTHTARLVWKFYQVGESGPDGSTPRTPDGRFIGWIPPDCWFILFSLGFHGEISPSRLVCIAKSNGEILFDGDVRDEG
jgi:hypothetical protein